MGTDIHAFTEVRIGDWWTIVDGQLQADTVGDLNEYRDYAVYGFLADVRNYSYSPVIAEPRGLPDDVTDQVRDEHDGDYHSTSWLTLTEMLAYDYEQVFWDRRVSKRMPSGVIDGAATAEEGEGRHLPLGEFLPKWYFRTLDQLAKLGDPADVRIVFWFDS